MGFPRFTLTNNNTNIRRIKSRIEQLERQERRPVFDQTVNGSSSKNWLSTKVQLILRRSKLLS